MIIRHFIGAIVATICCVTSFAGLQAVAQNEPEVEVTVIAVSKATHDTNQDVNKKLGDRIHKAAESVRHYFETQFSVPVRVFESPEDTSAPAIRSWLFTDLPHDSRNSVHLIFIITHGTEEQYPASPSSSELYIASSDTPADHFEGIAVKGSELLDGIAHLRNGSSVFVFLDTCKAGAIGNFASRLSSTINAAVTASRTMVLASSARDELSYNARFTEALVRLWTMPTQACSTNQEQISAELASLMNELDPHAAATPQNVALAIPFSNSLDFCVEAFRQNGALLLLFNPSYRDTRVSLETSGSTAQIVDVKARDVAPIALERRVYTLTLADNNVSTQVPQAQVDLTASFVQFRKLAVGTTDDFSVALAYEKAATTAALWAPPGTRYARAFRIEATKSYEAAQDAATNQMATLTDQVHENESRLSELQAEVQLKSERAKTERQNAEQVSASASQQAGNSAAIGAIAGLSGSSVAAEMSSSVRQADQRAELSESDLAKSSEDLRAVSAKHSLLETELNEVKSSIQHAEKAIELMASQNSTEASYDASRDKVRQSFPPVLKGLGLVRQSYRGTILSVGTSEAARNKLLHRIAELLKANTAVTLELESRQEGPRPSQELQDDAGKVNVLVRDKLLNFGVKPQQIVARSYGRQTKDKEGVTDFVFSVFPE